jgi:hypothetical protein
VRLATGTDAATAHKKIEAWNKVSKGAERFDGASFSTTTTSF